VTCPTQFKATGRTEHQKGNFFGSAGLAKVIGKAVFILAPTLREISWQKFLLPDFNPQNQI
jgi:hypothetical protein